MFSVKKSLPNPSGATICQILHFLSDCLETGHVVAEVMGKPSKWSWPHCFWGLNGKATEWIKPQHGLFTLLCLNWENKVRYKQTYLAIGREQQVGKAPVWNFPKIPIKSMKVFIDPAQTKAKRLQENRQWPLKDLAALKLLRKLQSHLRNHLVKTAWRYSHLFYHTRSSRNVCRRFSEAFKQDKSRKNGGKPFLPVGGWELSTYLWGSWKIVMLIQRLLGDEHRRPKTSVKDFLKTAKTPLNRLQRIRYMWLTMILLHQLLPLHFLQVFQWRGSAI